MDTTQLASVAALIGALILVAGGIGWSRLRRSTAVTYIAIWLGLAVLLALAYRTFG